MTIRDWGLGIRDWGLGIRDWGDKSQHSPIPNSQSPIPKQAFSLVEMAVVLAVIALMAGSVVLGTTVVRAQQARQVLQDATTYRNAIVLFNQSYGDYPGDFATATAQWGRADGGSDTSVNCAAPATDTASGGKATCNGDGDETIESGNYESFRAWQHLTAANMMTGFYTGVYVSGGTTYAVPGTNSPVSTIKNATFYVDSYGDLASDGSRFDGNYDNVLIFGLKTTNSYPTTAALSGKEAYQLDSKEDDGYPGFGDIRAWKNAAQSTCATTDVASTSRYDKDVTDDACGLFFLNTFEGDDEDS